MTAAQIEIYRAARARFLEILGMKQSEIRQAWASLTGRPVDLADQFENPAVMLREISEALQSIAAAKARALN